MKLGKRKVDLLNKIRLQNIDLRSLTRRGLKMEDALLLGVPLNDGVNGDAFSREEDPFGAGENILTQTLRTIQVPLLAPISRAHKK